MQVELVLCHSEDVSWLDHAKEVDVTCCNHGDDSDALRRSLGTRSWGRFPNGAASVSASHREPLRQPRAVDGLQSGGEPLGYASAARPAPTARRPPRERRPSATTPGPARVAPSWRPGGRAPLNRHAFRAGYLSRQLPASPSDAGPRSSAPQRLVLSPWDRVGWRSGPVAAPCARGDGEANPPQPPRLLPPLHRATQSGPRREALTLQYPQGAGGVARRLIRGGRAATTRSCRRARLSRDPASGFYLEWMWPSLLLDEEAPRPPLPPHDGAAARTPGRAHPRGFLRGQLGEEAPGGGGPHGARPSARRPARRRPRSSCRSGAATAGLKWMHLTPRPRPPRLALARSRGRPPPPPSSLSTPAPPPSSPLSSTPQVTTSGEGEMHGVPPWARCRGNLSTPSSPYTRGGRAPRLQRRRRALHRSQLARAAALRAAAVAAAAHAAVRGVLAQAPVPAVAAREPGATRRGGRAARDQKWPTRNARRKTMDELDAQADGLLQLGARGRRARRAGKTERKTERGGANRIERSSATQATTSAPRSSDENTRGPRQLPRARAEREPQRGPQPAWPTAASKVTASNGSQHKKNSSRAAAAAAATAAARFTACGRPAASRRLPRRQQPARQRASTRTAAAAAKRVCRARRSVSASEGRASARKRRRRFRRWRVQHVYLIGERNSGTNWVKSLLHHNLRVEIPTACARTSIFPAAVRRRARGRRRRWRRHRWRGAAGWSSSSQIRTTGSRRCTAVQRARPPGPLVRGVHQAVALSAAGEPAARRRRRRRRRPRAPAAARRRLAGWTRGAVPGGATGPAPRVAGTRRRTAAAARAEADAAAARLHGRGGNSSRKAAAVAPRRPRRRRRGGGGRGGAALHWSAVTPPAPSVGARLRAALALQPGPQPGSLSTPIAGESGGEAAAAARAEPQRIASRAVRRRPVEPPAAATAARALVAGGLRTRPTPPVPRAPPSAASSRCATPSCTTSTPSAAGRTCRSSTRRTTAC